MICTKFWQHCYYDINVSRENDLNVVLGGGAEIDEYLTPFTYVGLVNWQIVNRRFERFCCLHFQG